MSMDPRFGYGRVATVVTAAPNPTARDVGAAQPGFTASFVTDEAMLQGRLSLATIAGLIVALVAFYWWTRSAQGGG